MVLKSYLVWAPSRVGLKSLVTGLDDHNYKASPVPTDFRRSRSIKNGLDGLFSRQMKTMRANLGQN